MCFKASAWAISVLLLLVDHSVMVWAISVSVSVVSSLLVPDENFSVSELLNGSYLCVSEMFSSENRLLFTLDKLPLFSSRLSVDLWIELTLLLVWLDFSLLALPE
uniref:(northern house mosquito) hypothetical protein n=1 Tax=Culex pipiens TaxID=7175 RepID=A0A8D8FLY0_CULPI